MSLNSPAAVEGRTRYPKSLFLWPGSQPLKSGYNNAKIGRIVVKGKWRGFPIFTLALEERATCPRSCRHWLTCYGNVMPFAARQKHGPELEERLLSQLAKLNLKYPAGFLIRLHVLGDFYSVDYVRFWSYCLQNFEALHIYGYTARSPNTEIGAAVQTYLDHPRVAVRLSNAKGDWTTATIDGEKDAPKDAIVCPAQTEKTSCCATCSLCWETPKQIAFLKH